MLRTLRNPVWAGVAALVALVACAVVAGASASSPNSANAHLKHVFVIIGENHSLGGVIGDPMAYPTFTSLAHSLGVAENYYGVTHADLPNYLALVAGTNFGLNVDDATAHFAAPNLADQLEAHGYTWASYEESMPSAGYLGATYPPQGALYASTSAILSRTSTTSSTVRRGCRTSSRSPRSRATSRVTMSRTST